MDALSLVSLPFGPLGLIFALMVGLIGGLVKGVVGFAMPMIIISGLSSIVAPDIALAALILPTLVTNLVQAFRQGWRAAWHSTQRYWVFLSVGGVTLAAAAQLVRVMPQSILFIVIGGPIVGYAILQLSSRPVKLPNTSRWVEAMVGAFAGTMGGLSGVWGPPTVAYLTATETPKVDQFRAQGVIFGLGSVALALAHLQSGVLRAETLPLSVMMIFPAMLGMLLGLRIQDRIDQALFRKLTLWVLLIVGLNLIRRGLF